MRRFLILMFFVVTLCLAGSAEARKLALLVGVDEYDYVSSLKCCVNDMNTLKEALMKIGFEEGDIQLLVTGGATRDFPTKKRIERKISEILSSAGPQDLVFLAFSGHGAQEGKTVYFCPPEVETDDLKGTCVSIIRMMNNLARCKAKFKWIVVDACRNDPNQGPKGIGGKGLQFVPSPPEGIALFQSCAKGEESWVDHASGKSYFTKNFAVALSGEADTDHDGKLTLMEVCKWTTAQTKTEVEKAKNKTQQPYFSGSVSDFPLVEDLNIPKAKALAKKVHVKVENGEYAEAICLLDEAIRLCDSFDSWKRERNLAKKLLENEQVFQERVTSTPQLQPTSWNSFEWHGTTITKFIGKETKVVIPEGATEIEDHAFSGCSSLTSVVIPDRVKEIGGSAFAGCTALKEWSISSTHPYFKSDGVGLLTKDGKTLVACLASANEYRIPKGVTRIGKRAFEDCTSLTSVVFPEGLTGIDYFAFEGCSSLTSVVIPDSVKEIGLGAFAGCTALKEWTISSTHSYFKRAGVGLMTKDGKTLVACLASAKEYRIPEGVIEIGKDAFNGCSSLTSVVIPESVTEIGDSAFEGCTSLTSVVIPERVTKIGNSVFEGCSSLTSVVIPDSVKEIVLGAFAGCTALKEWQISSTHPYFKRDGIAVLTKDGKTLVTCPGAVKEYRIPEGVTSIGNGAFNGCSSLTFVVIPESVTVIGIFAFFGCSSLTSVVIPENVNEIGGGAFYGCSSLTSIVIPEGVTAIGGYTFVGCSSLTSVVIPESVTKIDYAFDGLPNLTIYGKTGSEAERYANEKGIPFKVKQ